MTLAAIWRWLMGMNLGATYMQEIQVLKAETPMKLNPVIDIRSTVKRHRRRKPSQSDVIRMKARA